MATPNIPRPQADISSNTHTNTSRDTGSPSGALLRDSPVRTGPLFSIIVPTYNEQDNVEYLVDELRANMRDLAWEVIFVDDDSPDGTANEVRRVAARDARVRCVQRIGRRGLSGACVEGMLASSAPYLAIMDGDLQHDPAIVYRMFNLLNSSDAELVIASRNAEGGSYGNFSNIRYKLSQLAARLGRVALKDNCSDPMSNFFALRRDFLEEVSHGLSKLSFKILLDILLTANRHVRVTEIPYVLGTRRAGSSKFESLVAWEYVMLLADKMVGRYVPVSLLAFAAIGALGAVVNLASLATLYRVGGASFITSEYLSTAISIVFNYTLNNVLTFRDRRRRGIRWLTGLLSFAVACGIGVASNIGLAFYLFNQHSGWFISALAGVLAGVVWNYTVSSFLTWRRGNQ